MLEERVARWPKQWLDQGHQEGLEEGLAKGLRKGKADLLKELASRRFGKLPQWAMDRFDRADVDALERWSAHLLDASRLEGVFDNDTE